MPNPVNQAFGNYPGQAVTPPNQIQTGGSRLDYGQGGHLFASGLKEEFLDEYISTRNPRFTATALFYSMEGGAIPVASTDYGWTEQDRIRRGAVIDSLDTAVGSATIDVTLTTATQGFFIPNDVVAIPSRTDGSTERFFVQAEVVAVLGGGTGVRLQKTDGTNWVAADISDTAGAPNSLLGTLTNAFGEGTGPAQARHYYPDFYSNQMQLFKKTSEITGTALHTATKVDVPGTPYFYYEQEEHVMDEFCLDREMAVMFGVGGNLNGKLYTEGVFTRVLRDGIRYDYSGAAVENTIVEALRLADTGGGPIMRFTGFAGSQAYFDMQQSLGARYIEGVDRYAAASEVGVNVSTYDFAGTKIDMVKYDPLSDPEIFRHITSTGLNDYINMRQCIFLMNQAPVGGEPSYGFRHFESGIGSRKFWIDHGGGKTHATGENAIGDVNGTTDRTDLQDKHIITFNSEMGAYTKCPNWHVGITRI